MTTAALGMDLGQHFIVGLSGTTLSPEDVSAIRTLKPAGVILRAHNFDHTQSFPGWTTTLANLIEAVKNESGRNKPIIALDHEGGRVHRVPAPLTHFPSAARYAAHAAQVAKAMAVELASIGINLSFAPVADIHSNPKNPVIGERAFGHAPEEVAISAVAFAKTLLAEGIIPVAKHFPGHGDTMQDSHEELPVLDLELEQLRSRELVPFKALVQANIPAILTAHVFFPRIDKAPATMSKTILENILRKELGFTGVVITDDLDMKAIALNYSNEFVAKHTLSAGCDMLLFNHDPMRAIAVLNFIRTYLEDGTLSLKEFESSHNRVTHFLQTFIKDHAITQLADTIFAQHAVLNKTFGA